MMHEQQDVVVVGASIGGCTAATLLARGGAQVTVVERRPDPAAAKRVCGHFLQSSAVPVLERLGVLGELEAAGAVRGRGRAWSRYGWTLPTPGGPESLSVGREVLDPTLRRTAAATPGVTLLLGHELRAVAQDDAGVRVVARGRDGTEVRLRTRALVGADGRGSRTAELAGIPTRRTANARFGYWGYFDGPRPVAESVRIWLLEPDVAIVTPTDGDRTLFAAFPEVAHAPAFKADPEAALRAFFARVPDAPSLDGRNRLGPMVGKLDLTSERRAPASGRIALVGDAALAADPVGAVGCGWALQSAEWLADALAGADDVPRALRAYARRHRRALRGHAVVVDRSSRERTLAPPQRLLLRAATRDVRAAERLDAFVSRRAGPAGVLGPVPLARAVAAIARG